MRVVLPFLLVLSPVLLAEPDRVELRYRFEKGQVLLTEQKQTFLQEVFAETQLVRWKIETEIVVQRTVLEVDSGAQPTIERVEVRKWRFHTLQHPEQEPGERSDMSEGQTFLWRLLDGRWRLFADGDRDVTDQLPALVSHLAGWRKARLPEEPIAVGATWEVDAARFFEASGMPSAEGTKGRAVFKLEGVADDVAEISFDMTFSRRDPNGMLQSGQTTGEWRFHVKEGRDLSSHMKGRVQFDNGTKGFAEIGMERTVTRPEDE
jgi:hypothetical protein